MIGGSLQFSLGAVSGSRFNNGKSRDFLGSYVLTRIAKKTICRHSDWLFSRCSEGGKRKFFCPGLEVEGGRKQHFMAYRRKKEYNWDQFKKFYMLSPA